MNLLVVDDHRDSAEALELLFSAWGHRVRVAHDGPGALAEVRDFVPDAVFLDLGLPGMDGRELLRRMRAEDRLADTRFVAVTGTAVPASAAADDFVDHLLKPVEPARLRELLEALS